MVILAVGCHPDDLEINCFGTLAKYIGMGHQVAVCTVANGDLGHAQIPPAELAAIRYREAEAAAKVIGASYYAIGVHDLHVHAQDPAQISSLARVVREVQPNVVITHYTEDYMDDHVQTSQLVQNATFAASTRFYDPQDIQHPAALCPLFYMDTAAGAGFLPTEYVDIADTMELKLEALRCHASQLEWLLAHDNSDALDSVRIHARERGHQCGVQYAVPFRASCKYLRMTTRRMLP